MHKLQKSTATGFYEMVVKSKGGLVLADYGKDRVERPLGKVCKTTNERTAHIVSFSKFKRLKAHEILELSKDGAIAIYSKKVDNLYFRRA